MEFPGNFPQIFTHEYLYYYLRIYIYHIYIYARICSYVRIYIYHIYIYARIHGRTVLAFNIGLLGLLEISITFIWKYVILKFTEWMSWINKINE